MTTMMLHVAGLLFRAPPEIFKLVAHEAVNRIGKIQASVAIERDDVQTMSQAIGHPASALLLDAPVRAFHGLVGSVEVQSSVELPRSHAGRSLVEVTILPRVARLRLRRQSRVFIQKSARDVMIQILGEHGVEARERLASTYPQRELIVQRDESDYAFFRRLASECGITFCVDHAAASGDSRMTGMGGTDILVLYDHAPYYQPIEGSPDLSFRRSTLEQALALS
jgi:type VI secretion system secreted protein VgrG